MKLTLEEKQRLVDLAQSHYEFCMKSCGCRICVELKRLENLYIKQVREVLYL